MVQNSILGIKSTIANEIKDAVAKATLKAPAGPTWAQIAASGGSTTSFESARQECQERLKAERTKQELTISLHAAAKSIVKQVTGITQDAELTRYIQTQVNGPLRRMGKQIQITNVRKTSAKTIRLYLNTIEDANIMKQLKWDQILRGAELQRPRYGIVVHGVSKADLDPNNLEEAKRLIEESNDEAPIEVLHVMPLMKKARNEAAPTQSIVFFLHDENHAAKLTNGGLKIGQRFHYGE
jgi:hypothetical protein